MTRITSPTQKFTRSELISRLVRAGELEVSGDDPAEVATYFGSMTTGAWSRSSCAQTTAASSGSLAPKAGEGARSAAMPA